MTGMQQNENSQALLTQDVLLQDSADHLQTDALQLLGDLKKTHITNLNE